jgi:hypothetical protein
MGFYLTGGKVLSSSLPLNKNEELRRMNEELSRLSSHHLDGRAGARARGAALPRHMTSQYGSRIGHYSYFSGHFWE